MTIENVIKLFPMLRFSSAFIWGILLFPIEAIRAEEIGQAEAVIRLLNLSTSPTDPLATANARKLLSEGMSPAEVVASNLHIPLPSIRRGNSSNSTYFQALELGRYVESHPDEFPNGLPDATQIDNPLQLGPFLKGLFDDLNPRFSAKHSQNELANLQPLLDDSWLEAAADCGSIHFQQLLLTHRGKLGELIHSYQESQDDIAMILLGETVANYPEALQAIEPSKFSARSLAYLLAGSFALVNPNEIYDLIEIAIGWTEKHPDLPVLLRDLRDPLSLSVFEATLLWKIGERESAVKQLLASAETGPAIYAGFVMKYFPEAALTDQEAASIIHMLPDRTLDIYLKKTRPRNLQNEQARIARMVTAEVTSRNDTKQTAK